MRILRIPIFICIFLSFVSLSIKSPWVEQEWALANTNRQIEIVYEDKSFIFFEDEWLTDSKFLDKFAPRDLLSRLHNMGFDAVTSVNYVYGKLEKAVGEICMAINKEPINSSVMVESGVPIVSSEEDGERVDVEWLYGDLFYKLLTMDGNIKVLLRVIKINPVYTREENQLLTNEKASFTTYINGENQEGRIQNIKEALSRLNGYMLMPNETLSFNKIIGETTKENGYSLAKVILNGKYADDYGGGVCQAATTLYNSALIAGLKVEKVRPHSLKVGYVLGSFDAMVSSGASDLVIKNPYSSPVFIHTYATEKECGVKIFGEENEYKIERRNKRIDFSEEEFPDVSYKSEGYLDYYKNDELIKTEKIRNDTYFKVKIEES